MARIDFKNDKTRAREETEGSDGRLNVSSRTDTRGYYNSRDVGRTYTVPYSHMSSDPDDFVVYYQNLSTDREFVLSSIGSNCSNDARLKLWFVTGTAAGGEVVTPTNTNRTSQHAADANVRQSTSGSAMTGIVSASLIDCLAVQANGHEEFRLSDRVRLGQNDAIAIEFESGSSASDVFGVMFGYEE